MQPAVVLLFFFRCVTHFVLNERYSAAELK
jgi:hypothetical protein